MVETIISYLNAKLEGTGYFHSLYCLVEKKKEPREEGDFVYPATYVGGGDLELVEFDSAGFAYFRKNGDFGQSVVANDLGQKQLYSIDLPLRLVAMVRRQDVVTDDAYSPDRLARELASILTFRNGDLRTFLQASRVTVTSGSWTTNPEQIWTDETEGTGRIEPDYSRAFIAMDVTVNVLADEGCIRSACTDEPDILRLFDFCDQSVVARLTDTQVTCLQDALCEACEDATVTVNTAPFGTAPSGGGLNVPVVNGGANPVGSKQGSDWVIGNNATFINGTQVTDQEAEVDANIFVTLDGTQSGTWNAGLQTWEVTSPACADANLEINGVQQETIASGATFNLIATLDGVAGGSYNAGTNTLSFTSNTGWQPDPNWPTPPSITSSDERFWGVVAVFENGYNVVSVSATNLAASSDWGDGTAATVSNGSPQFHVYDYASISATVYQWPDGRNVKYVELDITRVGGAITFLSFYNASTTNAGGGNNFVDIIMSIPNSTVGSALSGLVAAGVKPMSLLQRLRVKAVGANAAAFYQGTLTGMRSLRFLEWPYSTLGQYNNFSNGAGQVDDLGDIDWGTNTSMVSAFALTIAKKHGNLTANSATTALASYIVDAVRLEEFGDITATSATTLANFFGSALGSPMLTKVGTINAPACTTIASMFFRCAAFTGTSFTSCANITTTTSAFSNCPSIYWMEMFGLTRGVSFAGTAMGNYGMDLFANSIGTASGAQTITVTGTPFGALLTALDATALAIRLVMTGKGYTVVN